MAIGWVCVARCEMQVWLGATGWVQGRGMGLKELVCRVVRCYVWQTEVLLRSLHRPLHRADLTLLHAFWPTPR